MTGARSFAMHKVLCVLVFGLIASMQLGVLSVSAVRTKSPAKRTRSVSTTSSPASPTDMYDTSDDEADESEDSFITTNDDSDPPDPTDPDTDGGSDPDSDSDSPLWTPTSTPVALKKKPPTKKATPAKRTRTNTRKVTPREIELSITVGLGGGDLPEAAIPLFRTFLLTVCTSGVMGLERGGTLMHLHIQAVIRLHIASASEATKLIKRHLGWADADSACPPGAMVLSRKLRNKGLHTWHGMIGYAHLRVCLHMMLCMSSILS